MSDKRFNRVGGYVYDGEKCISHFEDVSHRDDIVKLLNELHEENEERKRAMRIAEHYNEQLLDENKKLKKYLDSISKGGLE